MPTSMESRTPLQLSFPLSLSGLSVPRDPMHVVGLLKQKGGSGATTIGVHLALAAMEAGRQVCIVDVDPQRSALSWAQARDDASPPVIAAEVAELGDVIAAAQHDGFDLVLVDTPPHSSAATAAVARCVTLAVLPTRPSALDLAAVPAVVQIVRATKTPSLVVLNACPPRAREVDEAREVLARYDLPVWDGQLGDRTAFRRAIATGQTVTEAEPAGKSAAEIRALWSHVAARLTQRPTRTPLR